MKCSISVWLLKLCGSLAAFLSAHLRMLTKSFQIKYSNECHNYRSVYLWILCSITQDKFETATLFSIFFLFFFWQSNRLISISLYITNLFNRFSANSLLSAYQCEGPLKKTEKEIIFLLGRLQMPMHFQYSDNLILFDIQMQTYSNWRMRMRMRMRK